MVRKRDMSGDQGPFDARVPETKNIRGGGRPSGMRRIQAPILDALALDGIPIIAESESNLGCRKIMRS